MAMLKILEHITFSGKSYKPGDPDVPEGTFGADESRLLGVRTRPTPFDHTKPALMLVEDAPAFADPQGGRGEHDTDAPGDAPVEPLDQPTTKGKRGR